MDATALYAYKHLDTYFIFPCLLDGYPSGLGTTLVQNIPTVPKEFNDWLRKSRKYYGRVLKKLEYSGYTDVSEFFRRPSPELPVNDGNIRWVYTIDLDNLVFSVDNGTHFKLDSIPRGEDGDEWIRYLGQDGAGRRCLKLSAPHSIVADLCPNVDLDTIVHGTAKYHSLNATHIEPTEWTKGCSTTELAMQTVVTNILKALIGHFYGTLCNACRYEPTDPRFRHPAERLLRASAPNFLQLYLDSEITAESSSSAPRKVTDDLRECGRGLFYWFRGCLILLSTRLDSEMHLRANIVRVVAHVKGKGLKTCTALIWSLRHVVVVRICRDQVSHSSAQPVLVAYGNDDSAFCTSVFLMAHTLRPVGVDSPSEVYEAISDTSPVDKDSRLLTPVSESEEFSVIGDRRPDLPTDVILEIMKFVDIKTYFSVFGRLSRDTRAVSIKRLRISSYTIYEITPATSESELPQATFGTETNANTNGWSLLGHTENGYPIRLSLVYQGHPFLGNLSPSAFTANAQLEKAARVSIRWPHGLESDYRNVMDNDKWLEVGQCGLYLQVLT